MNYAWAVIFAGVLLIGWAFAVRHISGTSRKTWQEVLNLGNAEARTMCILTMAWIGTLIANIGVEWLSRFLAYLGLETPHEISGTAPVLFYVLIDIVCIAWLLAHQTKNWQWIPTALFVAMLMTHAVFSLGVSAGMIANETVPYQHILAGLGYAQIYSVIHAARQRGHHGNTAFARWASGDSWVFLRLLGRGPDADVS